MAFRPIEAAREIEEKYIRYLRTVFSLSDPEYQAELTAQLTSGRKYANGPFLDVIDSFRKGRSVLELIEDGVLPKGFRRLSFHQTRPLYLHQQRSIEKVAQGKNVVVSTGTGSGKTESFLIPLLAHIIREQEAGKLDAGVRALLIYPMNALANDQIERLRDLLGDYPEITFGSYTGQTKNTYEEALAEYRALNDDARPLRNELISREQMKDTPPHILVTNYAMLEYLMIRPADSEFFREDRAHRWKFIVLDEAHVYSGSTGIEVSMLLRRLKARLGNPDIQYILTSATLGGEDSNQEVADFASNLCASPFYASDVIRADRVNVLPGKAEFHLPLSFYRELGAAVEEDEPEEAKRVVAKYCPGADGDLEPLLYDVLRRDESFQRIKEYLRNPKRVTDIAQYMGWSAADVGLFVAAASRAVKDGARLFDARYHMFMRATESVFATLAPDKSLFLNRKEWHDDPKTKQRYKVFEIGSCSFCHTPYIFGQVINDHLEQCSQSAETSRQELFLLSDTVYETDDDHMIDEEKMGIEKYEVCPYCGFLQHADLVVKRKEGCGHDPKDMVTVWKINWKAGEDRVLHKCPHCESTSPFSVVRRFFTGQEAVTSVLGTALFESLPSYKIVIEKAHQDDDDGFGFDGFEDTQREENEAKQFIAFSDSRQAAAFYASYMDQTYRDILYKRLLLETLKSMPAEGVPLPVFIDRVGAEMENRRLLAGSDMSAKKESWKAVLHELIDNKAGNSLFRLGLMDIGFSDTIKMVGNPVWGLSADEVSAICREMVLSIMGDAAINHDAVPLQKADLEDVTPGGVQYSYTYSASSEKNYRKAFVPSRTNGSNKRIEYVQRIAQKGGQKPDTDFVTKFMGGLWTRLLTSQNNRVLVGRDGSYRVNLSALTVSAGKDWYRCKKCGKITGNNVRNVCPVFHCDGELQPVDPEALFKGNHYYEMYQTLEIRPLRIVEHSAQLAKETAYEYQKEFKQKKIDILSCSTTFEMGVDVGSLETVFMRNMPPSPANYAQRAGRAGRSIDSAAFALTFCNKSNHDFTFFNAPEKMIRGNIYPPAFNVANEKIAIRHVYATAMGFFWKEHPELFKNAKEMLGAGSGAGERTGMDLFYEYLGSKPEDLKAFLKDFLPPELVRTFQVETYGWLDGLIGRSAGTPGLLTRAVAEYEGEVGTLLQELDKLNAQIRSNHAVVQRLRTYYNEQMIAFLSRKGIFPRYGFPVDTVELSYSATDPKLGGLQLSRDLSMAISEYAPDSQIVANGSLITSRYIKRMPNMLWKMYDYKRCSHCNSISLHIHAEEVEDEMPENCPMCGAHLSERKDAFIIPEFGFIADSKTIRKPGLVKPQRTFNNEIAYIGSNSGGEFAEVSIGNARLSLCLSQKDELAVINSSNFFVCEACGFADLDAKRYTPYKPKKHKNAAGFDCSNDQLKRYALGYRFQTDVVQVRFLSPFLPAANWAAAYSVLQGVLHGFTNRFSIDERDVSGCLQYFSDKDHGGGFSLVLYDNTPGGSGYVRILKEPAALEQTLRTTLEIMKSCDCGGSDGDSSCYSCLRNYYNQKHHDALKRKYVIDFIGEVLK